uniref:Large ribosomal subunit protein bL31c n=1 Tax=Malawimonas jakobiformis TaxID=136089 RepID=Q9G890_MALJA|nr:ribosomal protein L31 [Malawimonas jakobiformis]AAG13683.1 ribosomal protein L31 [Malawimonas jakobiformis]
MKKGIHPIRNNTIVITTKKNSYQINSIFNVNKLKVTIDPSSHIIYNRLLNINNAKENINLNRLRLFTIKK